MAASCITKEGIAQLKRDAQDIRRLIIEMIANAGSGHPGSALSAVEIVTYLYFYKMHIDPQDPKMHDRDRFVLSKGHACPVIYAALAKKNYFEESELLTLREIGSRLQGHPDMKKTPGVDMTTGSLGQGLSCAVGIALGSKVQKIPYKVYALLGDGEVQSGQVWEAAMAASQFKLDNLVVFVDDNGLQCDDYTKNIIDVESLAKKFAAFGFSAVEIDGHSFEDIDRAVTDNENMGKPLAIIAKTIKGKGVSFMENQVKWHGLAPDEAQTEAALKEIGGVL
jgi:transketolase